MSKAYFVADLHLGATYRDEGRETERRAVEMLDRIGRDADEIYLLGDILDYWFEYKTVVPRGFVRFFGKLAELADRGVRITWIIGNHDIWIFDYLPRELGIEVADGRVERDIMGTRFCLQHGDATGGTRTFRALRWAFRNRVLQKLYSGIHPRWTVGFAYWWSGKSRKRGYEGERSGEVGVEKYRDWVKKEMAEGNRAKYYVFGHLHLEHREPIENAGREAELIVVPDWPGSGKVGVFDGRKYVMQHI